MELLVNDKLSVCMINLTVVNDGTIDIRMMKSLQCNCKNDKKARKRVTNHLRMFLSEIIGELRSFRNEQVINQFLMYDHFVRSL